MLYACGDVNRRRNLAAKPFAASPNLFLAGSGDASPAGLMFLGLGLIGLRDRIERGFRGDA